MASRLKPMVDPRPQPLRVYVDADVILAGAASPSDHSASQVVLALSEITLIQGVTCALAVPECRRNLNALLPAAVDPFEQLVDRSLAVVEDPAPEDLRPYEGCADAKDLPLLVVAIREECSVLITYNTADYRPGVPEVDVLRPGALVRRVREQLATI